MGQINTATSRWSAIITATLVLAIFIPLSQPRFWAEEKEKEKDQAKKFTNNLGMEFALVPKGKSWISDTSDKAGVKEVTVADDFYLGVYEVTQEEWVLVMEQNPSHFSRRGAKNEKVKDILERDLRRFPVENVSWYEAQQFCHEVTKRAKETGWIYRLPTELEWEYACRGGPMTDKTESAFDFYFAKPTNTLNRQKANFAGNNPPSDVDEGHRWLARPTKVGSYEPNRLGLYDMHGNVWEWCQDAYKADSADRVYRGGGWDYFVKYCRAGTRYHNAPGDRFNNVGLRLARVPVGKG